MTSPDKTYQTDCSIEINREDPETVSANAEKVSIKPQTKGHKYKFGGEYSQIMPRDFYFVLYFGIPTIGVSFDLTHSADLRVTASNPTLRNGDMFEYEGLFMPGDHLYVRWERATQSLSHA